MSDDIQPVYGETLPNFEVGQMVWSTVFDMPMRVETRAYAAGRWAYCLVDPVDPDGEVYTAGLSSQVKQDRISEWHRESEVCERNPAEVEAEFQKEFWGEG